MIQFVLYLNYEIHIKHITKSCFHVSKHIWILCCTKPNHSARIVQLLNILCLVIYFGQEKFYITTTMEQEKQRCMLLTLSFIYSFDSHLLYVHITCFPLHTNLHSCSLYFVCSHIETNRITGQDKGLLTTNVEEDIQRCMLLLLFHIPLFCISFIVCIFILLLCT
jgi:hypothetical protein